MFHIYPLSPTRYAIRPEAHCRSLGFPDLDLDAKTKIEALENYKKQLPEKLKKKLK